MAGPAEGSTDMGPRALYWASQATMCVSILIFFYECFAYNMIYLRRVLPAVGKANLAPLFRILFNTVWALGLWSYHQAHWSDPGALPERWRHFVRSVGETLPIAPSRPEWQPGRSTLCKKCQAPRPERAHHCVLCGMCVLRMDHHCPWINNCVGFHNHKYFLLLGIYTWLASLIAVGTSLPELCRLAAVAAGLQSIESLQLEDTFVQMWDVWAFLLFGVFAMLIALLLTSLLSTHVPLACRNLTTIEDFYENMPNPYEQGSKVGNLAQVFGEFGLDWFLPVRPCRPLSDGITYPPQAALRDYPGYPGYGRESPRDGEPAYQPGRGGDAWTDGAPVGLNRWAMLHEEGADVEGAWSLRYRVRTAAQMKALYEESTTPFTAQFWACGKGQERERRENRAAAGWSVQPPQRFAT